MEVGIDERRADELALRFDGVYGLRHDVGADFGNVFALHRDVDAGATVRKARVLDQQIEHGEALLLGAK